MQIKPVNLAQKLGHLHEFWSPRLVGELNGQHVRIAKVKGEFVWHHHEDEDELFFVIHGQLTIELREQDDVQLNPGEFIIIPRGIEHRPVASEETHILLFEPADTVNTGNLDEHERTVDEIRPI